MLLKSTEDSINPQIVAPYFVEQVSHDGQLIARHRFDQLPIHIGRDYSNDLILDDVFVAGAHVAIDLDAAGQWQVRDMGTDNGIAYGQQRQTYCQPDAKAWQIGQTFLRLRHAGYAVAPALSFKDQVAPAKIWPQLLAVIVAFLLIGGFSIWVGKTSEINKVDLITESLLWFFGVAIWAAVWALLTKLIGKHEGQFAKHMIIAMVAMIATEFWIWLSGSLAYALSMPVLTQYSNQAFVLIFSIMIYWHLHVLKPRPSLRARTILVGLAILSSTMIILNNVDKHGHAADAQYFSDLYSPSIRLTGNQASDAFIDQAQSLKSQLDEARKEPVKAGLF